MLSRKNILEKTTIIGGMTAVSRILGMAREMLMTRYLGANELSDIFITAFAVPSALRKIFAEGALAAACVPQIVQTVHEKGPKSIGGMMTVAFIVFQSIVTILCGLIMSNAEFVILLRAPGFATDPLKIARSAQLLRVLAPYIFFLSSSSLLAGALHSVARFWVPAFGPILLNLVFIASILVCIVFNSSIIVLCVGILCSGFLLLLMHLIAYFYADFSFGRITHADLLRVGNMLLKFFFSAIAMSAVEVKLIIDSNFASYLPTSTISLIYYAERFMGIPLGIFASAFSTVLLTHLARVCKTAPCRLPFYLLESIKLVYWVTIPIMFVMMFFAHDIFITLFVSDKFSMAQAYQSGLILRVYLLGLFFYSANKILLNFFFGFQATWIPSLIAISSAVLNYGLNFFLVSWWQAPGLILASNIATAIETFAMTFCLYYVFKVSLAYKRFALFVLYSSAHIAVHIGLFLALYKVARHALFIVVPEINHELVFKTAFLWCWVTPLVVATTILFVKTRSLAKVELYFLG